MNRFTKLMATASLLALPIIAACGEDIMPPPPTGSIVGQVSIEGMGVDGVSVSLSNGTSTATAGGGNYRFDNVEQGSYTITISGFPADVSFDATSAPASIDDTGGTVTVDFRGTYIRTASIMGTVTVENTGLSGVAVRLSGMADAQTATDASGQYAFTGLRAGTYSVEISGFDADNVGFSSTSGAATVGVGESKVVSFDGTYLRTAGIVGQVIVEGEGLAGVTVSLGGNEDATTTTDAGGRYEFARLKAGGYAVAISGYDTEDYEFQATSKNVTLASGETANVPFEGTLLRTAGISGRVSVGGMGLSGVTVSLSGMDDPRETTTNAQGQYGFAGLAEGNYTITISGYDATEYAFEAEKSVSLERGDSKIENFEGTSLRTAGVAGMVTVEETGVAGVTVTLIRVTGATSGDVAGILQTGDDGGYAFGDLLAGIYRVDISGFDAEYAFEATSWQGQVATATVAKADFPGTIIRTASVSGMVTVEGEGKEGVTVSLAGGTDAVAESATTGADGGYMFAGLRRGDYTVTITNPDAARYSFTATERKVSLGIGQQQDDVSFAGTMLRQGSISGRVHAEGDAIPGVTVTLAGAMEATRETDDQGNYAFTNLAPGTYVVSISDWNEDAYAFVNTTMNVTLDSADDKKTADFDGTHTRTASVTGKAFIDEAAQDKMYTANEPALEGMEIPLKLQGPGLNDETAGAVGMDGDYAFEDLRAGDYRVLVDMTSDLEDKLDEAGYSFAGDLIGHTVTVAAGAEGSVNLPFRITIQTIEVGAVMGNDEETRDAVEGVELALYPTSEDLEDGTNMLGEAMMTGDDGMATFHFPRDDDSSPGSEDTDHLVFVKVLKKHDDLAVSDNNVIEVEYAATARTHAAPASVKLLNTAVAFDFWVKSTDAVPTERGGDTGLGGWNTQVYMGEVTDESMPLMVEADGEMVNATMPTDDGEDSMADLGKSSFAYTVDPTMLPATFTVMAAAGDDAGQPDMGEAWEQGDALTFTHTGLDLPPGKDDDMLDLGPLRVTFTTQAIYVGVHRELDDRTGFTDFIGIGEGDDRPEKDGSAVGEITITLMTADSRGRLRVLEYDDDADPKTPDEEAVATVGATGMVSFKNIPADTEITVVADEGNDMVIVPDSRSTREIDAFGDQLDDYPDGVIVGAFGDMSGARPDVWLCPLQRQTSDDPNEYCSTYAYKWETGTISGSIAGLDKGDKATVSLTPVNSNDDYADDLEKEETITAGNGGAAEYKFDDVADGRYRATLAAKAGSWQEDETDVLSVMHAEDNDDDEYTGDSATGNLDATNLRGVIRGRIANDSNGRSGLTSDESRAGVMVGVYTAKLVGGSGDTKSNYVEDKVVTDANGDPLMKETDRDGVYMFEGLTREAMYFVKPVETDLYTAVRNGNAKIGKTADKTTDVVTYALVEAGPPPAAGTEPEIPTWDYNTSTADVGDADFVLLYKDGEVEGKVSDPSTRAAHSRSVIELHQCKVSNYVAPTDPTDPTTGTAASQCTEYNTDVEVELVDVDAKGNWSADGLMEGLYEVIPDLPAGYISVDENGLSDATAAEFDAATFHSQQFVELRGGRADDDTQTFHIKDRNAGNGATLTSVAIAGAPIATCTLDGSRCIDNEHDEATISVTVRASTGATVRLSTDATNANASGGANRSMDVNNGRASTVTLPKAGSTTFFVHVAAADGYSTNLNDADPPVVESSFEVRRDADIRVETVTISWNGDKLVLDREELGVDPDGETDPVTGTTTLRVTLDKGDGGDAVPNALTVRAVGMDSDGFGVDAWSAEVTTADTACPTEAGDYTDGDVSATLVDNDPGPPAVKGSVIHCFRINDTDGAGTPDANVDNYATYRLILTRK